MSRSLSPPPPYPSDRLSGPGGGGVSIPGLLSFVTLFLTVPFAVQASPEITLRNDEAAAQALLGQHRFSLQWISTQKFGVATITDDGGVFRIKGHQTDQGSGEVSKARSVMTIEGVIASIGRSSFEFEGEIMIRLGYGPGREPCKRTGKFVFGYRQANSRSWRLEDRLNPCIDHVDYVDIYVDRDWRPDLPRPGTPTEAELWGIGLVTNDPAPDVMPGLAVFPDLPLPLYDQPRGRKIGITSRAPNQWDILIQRGPSEPISALPNDSKEVGYESRALVVFARESGYLDVFRHSVGEGLWIKEEDLASERFLFLSWLDFLAGKSDGSLYPRRPLAINLRTGPQASSTKIATLNGELFNITPSGRKQGMWLEVEVVRYDVHPCTDGNGRVAERWRGWVKAVDDEGYPNLWYPTRGC